MAWYKTNTTDLTSVASAIRTKSGTSNTLVFPTGYVTAINNLFQPTVTIKSGVTNVGTYFRNNEVITELNLPGITAGDSYCFASCTHLTKANLPSMKSLPTYSFNSDSKLTEIRLGSCTSIDNYAFKDCSALTAVYITTSSVCSITSLAVSSAPSGVKFYVPSSLLSSYKAASNWSTIASRIYAIS